jgi:uncharacterized protein YxjI
METYQVTQKVLSLGPTYQVRTPPSDEVKATVKGKLLTAAPKLSMVEGNEGNEIASMKANFLKTKFQIFGADKTEVGTLAFPLIALKKSFVLTLGEHEYKAEGGILGGHFKCTDARGEVILEIAKELALKDKFSVSVSRDIPREVALLAAVAIDQKFFEEA